jgi:hypothetical protein
MKHIVKNGIRVNIFNRQGTAIFAAITGHKNNIRIKLSQTLKKML